MKKRTIIIISLIVLVGIIIGITYAWWDWINNTNTNVTFTMQGATVTYSAGNNISNIKLIPVSSKEKGESDGTGIAKTITASADKTMYLTLNMALTTFPSGLASSTLVWEIYKGNTKIGNGNFAGKSQGNTITLFENQEINSTTSTYKLYIWIDGNQDNPLTMENQNFVLTLNATATEERPPSALPDFILNSNAPLDSVNSTYVTGYYESYTIRSEDKATLKNAFGIGEMSDEEFESLVETAGGYGTVLEMYNAQFDPDIELTGVGTPTPGINFKQNASDTNGKGLYIRRGTENNINPIYYYRGAVDNNNVYFANFCWKIVRTTDTGGLKMIYNGSPTSGTCGSGVESQENSTIGDKAFNRNYNDAKYVGYTYEDNGAETDSTIKVVIDTWYETNLLTNYDNYIEDTVYCNDGEEVTSVEKTQIETAWDETYDKLYKSIARVMNTTPSLECTNNSDKYTKSASIGNGKLTFPVGLLTMDEIWLAGVGLELERLNEMRENPTSNYLDNSSWWWSLSPFFFYYGYAGMWNTNNANGLYGASVDYAAGVRPAISLKPGQNFTYGNGTVSNPYRFVETVTSG